LHNCICEVTDTTLMLVFSCLASQNSIVPYSRQSSVNEELGRYNERVNFQHASTLHLCKDIEEEQVRSMSSTVDQQLDQSGKDVAISHDQHAPLNDHPSHQDDQPSNQPDQQAADQITTSVTESETTKSLERAPSVEPTDAASPAYQFITWHDVYAYMRTEGVKVSLYLVLYAIVGFYFTLGNW